MINKVIIGAPFGNYLGFRNTTRTLGTFTLQNRGGFLYRIWKVLSTVRYDRRQRSWINKLGLPNPGIRHLKKLYKPAPITLLSTSIISIHGFNADEWCALVRECDKLGCNYIEANLSCPNVGLVNPADLFTATQMAQEANIKLIGKLPPDRWAEPAKILYEYGVRHFHLCNSIPTRFGGVSGKPLMRCSLNAINDIKSRYNDITVIGGGGITCLADVKRYKKVGADHIALASMLFNPCNWLNIKEFVSFMTNS